MSITELYNEAPVLATILTLAYAVVMGVFVYMLFKMYKK